MAGNPNVPRPMTRRGELLPRTSRELTPFSFMGRMMDEMDRFFGGAETGAISGGRWAPRIEVREKDGKLLVHADLPGVKPDDVELEVRDDVLYLRGERSERSEEDKNGVYHSEVTYGRFERAIPLPQGTDQNAIEAKFENGVLEVSASLPKPKEPAKKIEVKGQTKKQPSGPQH